MLHRDLPARAVLLSGQGTHVVGVVHAPRQRRELCPFPTPAGLSGSAVTRSQKPELPGSSTATEEASRLNGLCSHALLPVSAAVLASLLPLLPSPLRCCHGHFSNVQGSD